jgi:hypothetical protein
MRSHDQRVVRQIHEGTGKVLDSQREVGGWPKLADGAPPTDTDGDGLPDIWEQQHRFDPKDPLDGAADAKGNGDTNLEEYLNQSTPR